MRVLGVESTAHTFGVGIVDARPVGPEDEGASPPQAPPKRSGGNSPRAPLLTCSILANERALYVPPPLGEKGGTTGGIHPREAANHHAAHAAEVLGRALGTARLSAAELDAIAFSQGPGLGPCLRTGATVARALALRYAKPLIAVNHCVAHLEIGRALCGVDDPLLLYASGGNTQVIAYAQGRYRVFGETLDVGVGNFLDKLARHLGLPFPGGPAIEQIARSGSRLLPLPYSVKGMDVAFSGILTAADALLARHVREDVCFSVQETTFAMLTEVTERALAHVGKEHVVLGGGVACNERLAQMVREMCEDRGARCHRPPKDVLIDNGAMIAWTGALALREGLTTRIEDSAVDQRQRTDDVDAPWRTTTLTRGDPLRGAEATVHLDDGVARKVRPEKRYRHRELDRQLRAHRTRSEARLLSEAREARVRTPLVLDVDVAGGSLTLQRVRGERVRDALDGMGPTHQREVLAWFGEALGRLHAAGIVHGDPTTSNAFIAQGGVVLIDFGLATKTGEVEDHATDLHVLEEALEATHRGLEGGMGAVLDAYRPPHRDAVLEQLEVVKARGRYRGT